MRVADNAVLQPSMADKDIRTSMHLLSTALNDHIQKCRPTDGDVKRKVLFHQLVDLMLANWSTFFIHRKSSKYKKIFQRAFGIQPQLAQLDVESFDIDRHQHDLECLARMASSIKRIDIEQEIRKLLPHQPEVSKAILNNFSIKEACIKLEEDGKNHFQMKEWKLAMSLFSQAICLNSEEGILYSSRAMCEIHLSKFQLAIEDAQDAVELDPKCAEFRRILTEASSGTRPCQPIKSTSPDSYHTGRSYFYGANGFIENHLEAEKHLKIAATTGHLEANLLLAKLLLKNERSSEAFPFLQHAAERNLIEAQYLLGHQLIHGDGCSRHEPTAKKWLFKAHAQGFKPKNTRNAKWVDEIMRNANSLLRFELQNNIDCKGISLVKRLSRFDCYNHFEFDEFDKLLESAIEFQTCFPGKETKSLLKPAVEVWMPLMMERAKNRSFKAQSFFIAHGLIMEAKKLLLGNQTVQSLKMLREARRLWDYPVIDTSMFVNAAEEMLKNNQANAEAYHVLVCSDKCSSIENKIWLAVQCVKLEPSIADFHHSLGRVYGSMRDYRRAERSMDKALQILVNSDWLYDRAQLLWLKKVKPDLEIVNAYERYISRSPNDAAHVPHAHYCIALTHHAMSRLKDFAISLKKGQKAESSEIRLPCFRAVKMNDYVTKQVPKHNMKPKSRPAGEKKIKEKIFEILCVVCSKGNPLQCCPFCHNWTCGKDEHDLTAGIHECQANHIAYHKSVASTFTKQF